MLTCLDCHNRLKVNNVFISRLWDSLLVLFQVKIHLWYVTAFQLDCCGRPHHFSNKSRGSMMSIPAMKLAI